MSKPIIGGLYRHYKSKGDFDHVYRVIGIAKHSETDELLVIYEALYRNTWLEESDTTITARPLEMFMETVEVGGKIVPRFELIFSQGSE